MENSQLYTLNDEQLSDWQVVKKCQLKTGTFLLVFSEVPLRLMEVLRVTCTQAPTTQVMDVDENENVVTSEVQSSPAFTTVRDSFGHGAVRLLEGAGLVRIKSIKRGQSLSDVGIGLGHNRNEIGPPPWTALPLMAHVTVKDVVAENASGGVVELSSAERNAYKQLQTAMKFVGMV